MAKRKTAPLIKTYGDTDADLAFSKLSRKDQGRSIQGQPDQWDVDNIQKFIKMYEHAYPGRIARMKEQSDMELALSGRDKEFGTISKEADHRKVMWMPADLKEVLQRAYPSIWTNKDHLAWFLRHFPVFKAAPKY